MTDWAGGIYLDGVEPIGKGHGIGRAFSPFMLGSFPGPLAQAGMAWAVDPPEPELGILDPRQRLGKPRTKGVRGDENWCELVTQRSSFLRRTRHVLWLLWAAYYGGIGLGASLWDGLDRTGAFYPNVILVGVRR